MKCKNFVNSRQVGGKAIESITSIEDLAEEIWTMMLSVEDYRYGNFESFCNEISTKESSCLYS